ncbi:PQQ-dependent sugar dehydrogenase [Chondrinema litorale]|uniref:PQQ-dependent sugar dehydrogenase n=1 Tax=Chondrinema litorale TaxID=2994555 RepID=UPI0025428866|nr:PQQ-dependent sugar dehydrogenase [Chondrinema litorale]UZR99330.1 PQQ-dependent sugar dehydrogenase [Chondrinema litorale]
MKINRNTLIIFFLASFFACSQEESVISSEENTLTYFDVPSDSAAVTNSEKLDYIADTVATELENPWGMAFLPNGSMLITERPGRLRMVKDGKLLPKEITGLPEVFAEGQGGLLDIELHPDFENNSLLYLSYSAKGEGGSNTAVMRAKLEGNALTNQEVIFQATPFTEKNYHFGSRIKFDNDGYMYITVGDRGERDTNPQSIENFCGKVHRLYDDGKIPEDNPFVNEEGAVASIYSYGHRNLQGLAKHPVTGEIWEHEHGPQGGDEVNIIKAGANYGWPVISYGINYDNTILTEDTAKAGMEQPMHYWDPSIAPCGMAFVTSEKYPHWKNNLLVGSLKFRYLARCEVQDGKVVHEEKILDTMGRVRAVEQAPDGYIYVAMESPGLLVRIFPSKKADQ